jgi:hypothetical protein
MRKKEWAKIIPHPTAISLMFVIFLLLDGIFLGRLQFASDVFLKVIITSCVFTALSYIDILAVRRSRKPLTCSKCGKFMARKFDLDGVYWECKKCEEQFRCKMRRR